MRLTVLGACGAWPEPEQACSGFQGTAGEQYSGELGIAATGLSIDLH